MEDIELSNHTFNSETTNQYVDSNHSDTETIIKDNISSTSYQPSSRDSNIDGERPNIEIEKSLWRKQWISRMPPLPLIRTILKASIAILIALLFVFVDNCRNAIGTASILVPIGTLLHFPIQPLGKQKEN
ncbi:uncharacterized protein BX663DRAFT_528139 [Cokeromyces recurvatus]|uniref:uncharacterized protein n=1 Tax=Cokeromyces recurvatus TaxID=90255 RepID=UPI00221F8697|nr:uncharacterized protein BX663DRAFT_528139 [Cokeromyces recurvatus]KAI7897491.1 hypothetical protein BX663DRAFT_528139 [Cokeromyces recurvatus]